MQIKIEGGRVYHVELRISISEITEDICEDAPTSEYSEKVCVKGEYLKSKLSKFHELISLE